MTKCKRCNGSGTATYHRADGLAIDYLCPDCKATKTMTNYDRIMDNMTIEQMALIFIETDYIAEDGFTTLVYRTPFSTGYWIEMQSAIDEIVEWLKSEVET